MKEENIKIALKDILSNINSDGIEEKYLEIYEDYIEYYKEIFPYFHKKLNFYIKELNKALDLFQRYNREQLYYTANLSRGLLELLKMIKDLVNISKSKYDIKIINDYQEFIDFIQPQLKSSYGSEISPNYRKIDLIEYVPIFTINDSNQKEKIKNIIFASTGYKPDMGLDDALENKIIIFENAESCLVYDFPIKETLTIEEVKKWYEKQNTGIDLYKRLIQSISEDVEKKFFNSYIELVKLHGLKMPILLPQVYLHYDPKTIKELRVGKRLPCQRIDFLLLVNNHRIIIEIDGVQHYSDVNDSSKKIASPKKYAEMVSYNRKMQLCNYEVYRFGGWEFYGKDTPTIQGELKIFFEKLFEKVGFKL